GTTVALHGTPAADSVDGGWDGCTRPPMDKPWRGCRIVLTGDASVRFTFNLAHCGVPYAKGKTLAAAKKAIWSHHCSVGKITKVESIPQNKGRVISQNPKPGKQLKHGARIALKLGK